jgi:hypothetical protein
MLGGAMDKRFCVITPYFRESREMLEFCAASVARQTLPADHMFIADGHPQDWLDELPVRHVKLDRAHGDYGNLARGLGALMAAREKYDGIAFLDADNWYDEDHMEACLAAAAANPETAYVVAQRRFVRPNRSIMETVTPADLPLADHIDTNCYVLLPNSYHLLHYWSTLPKELATHGDMLFRHILKNYISIPPAITAHRTVNYSCMFEGVYLEKREIPPEGAKEYVDWRRCQTWLDALSDRDLALVQRLAGLNLTRSR